MPIPPTERTPILFLFPSASNPFKMASKKYQPRTTTGVFVYYDIGSTKKYFKVIITYTYMLMGDDINTNSIGEMLLGPVYRKSRQKRFK